MDNSLKRAISTDAINDDNPAKVFKHQIEKLSVDELLKKVDENGMYQETADRCKVSELPRHMLLEIASIEQITVREDNLWKVLLTPAVKTPAKMTHKNYNVLLNTSYTEALEGSTHLIYMGLARSKNNRNFNKIKFFNCSDDQTKDFGDFQESPMLS